MRLEFDAVGGNPPWNGGVYKYFLKECQSWLADNGVLYFYLPTNWMTLVTFKEMRNDLRTNFDIVEITILSNDKKQMFDIGNTGEVVLIGITKNTSKNKCLTKFKYLDNPQFKLDLHKINDIYPLYKSKHSVSILDKVMSAKISDIPFNKKDWKGNFISAPTKVHARVSADFMDKDGSKWELNKYKGIADEQTFMMPDSVEQAESHYDWFKSKWFSYILTIIKSQGKNQPHPIAVTGLHAFKHDNTDFKKYFGFTEEEEKEVDEWMKSPK